MPDPQNVEVLGIDITRFVAATLVIMWHFAGKPFLSPATATIRSLMPLAGATIPPGAMLTSIGWIGVQIFFVISGAVIAFSAGRAESRKAFLVNRFARLWPGMLASASLCSVLSIIFWHTGVAEQTRRLAGSLIFSPVGPWFSGQVWTLPVEVAFYAVVGVFVVGGGTSRLERVAWCLAVWSAAYWAVGTVWLDAFSRLNDHLQAFVLLRHGCYFALGIAIAKASTSGYTPGRLFLLSLTAATACLEITARLAGELGTSPYRPATLIPCSVWLGAVLLIIASFRWHDRLNAAIARFAWFIQGLGALTYPLYLVHYQTGGPIYAFLIARGWSVWGAFLPAYGVAIGVALVIVVYVERPMRRQIKARLKTRSAITPDWGAVASGARVNAPESIP